MPLYVLFVSVAAAAVQVIVVYSQDVLRSYQYFDLIYVYVLDVYESVEMDDSKNYGVLYRLYHVRYHNDRVLDNYVSVDILVWIEMIV